MEKYQKIELGFSECPRKGKTKEHFYSCICTKEPKEDSYSGCACRALVNIYPYGTIGLRPERVPLKLIGINGHTFTCVGEMNKDVDKIIKQEELEKMLGALSSFSTYNEIENILGKKQS